MSPNDTPTTLYRLYDECGDLLYVGISVDFGRRMGQHSDAKPWWQYVDRVELTHYDTRAEALSAEARAISVELPAFNKQGIDPNRHWVRLHPGTLKWFGDCCNRCRDLDPHGFDWKPTLPENAWAEGEWMTAFYTCEVCSNTWSFGWAWQNHWRCA